MKKRAGRLNSKCSTARREVSPATAHTPRNVGDGNHWRNHYDVDRVLPIDDNENGQETSDGNIQNPPVAKYKDFCDDCYKLFKIYDRKAIRAHLTKFHGYQYAPDPDLDEVPPRPQNEFRSCCRKIFSSQVELDENILKCPKC